MPDKRRHRGPHPADAALFAAPHQPALRAAVQDLSWLLSRGYAEKAALKLVGDRYQLAARQRLAVLRSACSDVSLQRRQRTRAQAEDIAGADVEIDGFNLLTTIEAALSGGWVLIGRDGCHRDLASMHGSYRKVEETRPALEYIGQTLDELQVAAACWLFDRPVSNSGRICEVVRETAARHGWSWQAEVSDNPDEALIASPRVVVSADSVILDRCARWFDLAGEVIRRHVPGVRLIDLRPEDSEETVPAVTEPSKSKTGVTEIPIEKTERPAEKRADR